MNVKTPARAQTRLRDQESSALTIRLLRLTTELSTDRQNFQRLKERELPMNYTHLGAP